MSAAPPTLAGLQAAFAAAVIDGDAGFLGCIEPGGALPPAARLQVYADAYRARLADTLSDTHGHTERYLGEDGFRELALAYVGSCVPGHYSLRWYGAGFPGWLATNCPDDPEVAELARLDAALRSAFDSADAAPLQPGDLAGLGAEDWERAVFVLHPAFQLLELRHNTVAIWQALEMSEPPPQPAALPRPVDLLVWRRGWQPHFRSLVPEEARMLAALHAGLTFGLVCEELARSAAPGTEVAVLAGTWLRRWLAEELLVALR